MKNFDIFLFVAKIFHFILVNLFKDQSPVLKKILEVHLYDENGVIAYDKIKNRHDLALLKIEKLEYNEHIQPACFPHNFRIRSKKQRF